LKTISVQVQGDHLETLARTRSPIDAVAEMIWNSLDADATLVQVSFESNAIGGLRAVRVLDNGLGLPYDEAVSAFEKLGGSWKKSAGRTRGKGRLLHGKQGKGRFRAFALGDTVEWKTRFADNGGITAYAITGRRASLATFEVGDARKTNGAPGTEVAISDLTKDHPSLRTTDAVETLSEQFALYLRQYPGITISYDGTRVDPAVVESSVADYDLPPVRLGDGREIGAVLTVIEWRAPSKRALFLCDAAGFTLHEMQPGIQAPGFSFTAYLKAEYMRELEAEGAFMLEELHPELKTVLAPAKEQLRTHFRRRAAEAAGALVEEWKRQDVYPYTGEPRDVIEEVERKVFDVVALNVNEYLPEFDAAGRKSKRLSFGLIREAIGSNPSALQRILGDVLELPKEKQEELAELLQRTSLEAIINASKIVADRLNFLTALELLVFDEPSRSTLRERTQLHRILADHTWIFGEEFNLSVDDQSLTSVLRAHLKHLGREPADQEPVLRSDGTQGIVDLMLSRLVPQPKPDQREHLVVELKAPSVKIDNAAMLQLQSYAEAVAQDARFKDSGTKWVFWALSNELKESVRNTARQPGRPEGTYYEDPERRYTVWVKTWGQLVLECKARLQFFQNHLKYAADNESALAYLRAAHAKYLPPGLAAEGPSPKPNQAEEAASVRGSEDGLPNTDAD
jgi:hypothetical protein